MRFIKYAIILMIVLAIGGFGIYYVGTNMASEKLVDKATGTLESSGQLEDIKAYVENDPEMKTYIQEAESADKSKLPFQTKGEATRMLIQKVGIGELKNIQESVQSGTMSQQEAINKLESELSEEEMLALKVIAYEELYK